MVTMHCNRQETLRQIPLRMLLCLGLLLLSGCATEAPKEQQTVFYPPLPELPRVQFLTTINTERDVGGGGSAFRQFVTGEPEETRSLVKPFSIAHEKGKLYIADTGMQGVVVIDLAKAEFEGIKDTKGGPLRTPMSIYVAEDGYKYVADRSRGQIVVFNKRDEFHRAYGAEKQFEPVSVAVRGNRIYVADVSGHEVEILDKNSGEVISKIGRQGSDEGQFHWPTHLAFDTEGNLYVTDFLNFRVQKFDKDGKFIKSIGELGTFPGAMPRPKGIAIDREGNLYAVDVAFELVQIFDIESAKVLLGFGKSGEAPGASWLPAGVHLDYDNLQYFSKYVDKNFRPKYLIYVGNQSGPRRLNIYAFGEWIGPPPKKSAEPAKAAGS